MISAEFFLKHISPHCCGGGSWAVGADLVGLLAITHYSHPLFSLRPVPFLSVTQGANLH